ncbi:phytanoyl-CoA dioxygenase family protein [Paenibacillus cymbidii]|uniref:phytanoyl-CoA dioxygenase family protein n=1 Tax=Paenibacillus cymbidii TaxID=1639034 RepID=UPI0010811B5C|nr:phytanoyl-CoA dioxygenase family protein [Paenibacillus cymbidii]
MVDYDWLPSDHDMAFFNENGYWISPKIIDDERLTLLNRHMDNVYNGEFETGRAPWKAWKDTPGLRQTDNCHWADYTLRELAVDPLIGRLAAKLLNTKSTRLWHDQLLYKPGTGTTRVKANVGWHQDYSYWQCVAEPALVTAWVAFDDVSAANGCMQVVPGSHKQGLMKVNDFYEQNIEQQERGLKESLGGLFKPVPIEMKAGQVSFHHALTIHGSGANTTDRPRRSMAIHLMSGEARYKAGTINDHHMNVRLFQPKDGERFVGDGLPLLYEEK